MDKSVIITKINNLTSLYPNISVVSLKWILLEESMALNPCAIWIKIENKKKKTISIHQLEESLETQGKKAKGALINLKSILY